MGTSIVDSWCITSPDSKSLVVVEMFEEHHMGASTIRMQVSLACEAKLPIFYSTGGRISFTVDSSHLLVWDRMLVIAIATDSGKARNFAAPEVVRLFGIANRPRFVETVVEQDQFVLIECEDGFHKNHISVTLPINASEGWELGLGQAKQGLLPSTYVSDYNRIARECGDASKN